MNPLDLLLLSQLGNYRYMSISYLRCLNTISSVSNLRKRLKILSDRKLVKAIKNQFEPLLKTSESFYFLTKQGVKTLLQYDPKFASETDVEFPQGGHNIATHDMAINWVEYFIRHDTNQCRDQLIQEMQFESRHSRIYALFHSHFGNDCLPDALWKVWIYGEEHPKTFLLEIDNNSEFKQAIHNKMNKYRHYLSGKKNTYVLFIEIKDSFVRLRYLMNKFNGLVGKNDCAYGCKLHELYQPGMFSNIYYRAESMGSKEDTCHRFLLPL